MIAPWAKEEMATADFGDERLDARARIVLAALGSRPTLSIPAACGGHAETQGAYRFFDNDKVTFEKVLGPHIACSRERVAAHPVVLLVQDTSEIDLTRPAQEVAGAGDLDGSRRGVLLHEMQAFTPEGIPLGTVWAEIVNRTEAYRMRRRPRNGSSASNCRSKRKKACVGSRDCVRHARWPSKCPQHHASASAIARPTSMNCSPNHVASGLCIG